MNSVRSTMDRADLLAAAFPPVSEAEWRMAAARSGASTGARNLSDDGIAVGPIYRRHAGTVPILRPGPPGQWRIVSRISATDAASLTVELGDDLTGGAGGIEIALAGSVHPMAAPAPAPDAVLGSIIAALPEGSTLRVDAGARGPAVALTVLAATQRKGLEVVVAADVATIFAARGVAVPTEDLTRLAAAFEDAEAAGVVAVADGRFWHAAGASEAQELAAVLASVIEHLRALAPMPVDRAMARLGVALAADADQFMTMAKLRAMRLLLGRVAELAGVAGSPVKIHAETAWRMMSRRESRMNALRAAGAAFAAATGGSDSITVLPFDGLDGTASAAARRLARNTQLILVEETRLPRFADPGAGSGAVEALTDALAEAAWERFQRIEAAGGLMAEMRAGTLLQEIAAARVARLARMRSGAMQMVGVNAFAEEVLAPSPRSPDAGAGALVFQRLADDQESVP